MLSKHTFRNININTVNRNSKGTKDIIVAYKSCWKFPQVTIVAVGQAER